MLVKLELILLFMLDAVGFIFGGLDVLKEILMLQLNLVAILIGVLIGSFIIHLILHKNLKDSIKEFKPSEFVNVLKELITDNEI
jgi:uncharacterized membrane protein